MDSNHFEDQVKDKVWGYSVIKVQCKWEMCKTNTDLGHKRDYYKNIMHLRIMGHKQ